MSKIGFIAWFGGGKGGRDTEEGVKVTPLAVLLPREGKRALGRGTGGQQGPREGTQVAVMPWPVAGNARPALG